MRYAFAGDRQISVEILQLLLNAGHTPLALFVSDGQRETHAKTLRALANLDDSVVFEGKIFSNETAVERLKELNLDYVICIHFPYIIREDILNIPRIGFLNLHPSYLPYNKGWHTPSWAILDGTLFGATLHFMTKELDKGDIILRKEIEVLTEDTANSLYIRVWELEIEIFKEALPQLINLSPEKKPQLIEGTSHSRKNLKQIQKINLETTTTFEKAIDLFRALTTNDAEEAAYFEKNGRKYKIQVNIQEMK